MGLISNIFGRLQHSGTQADTSIELSVPRNANLRRETTTWTKGNQTIESTGLLGWDDPFMDFDQSMNKAMQESQFIIHGWKKGDTVTTAASDHSDTPPDAHKNAKTSPQRGIERK